MFAFHALLWTSGSPFSSKHSVGWHLQGPTMMLGLDMSAKASNLSSGIRKAGRRSDKGRGTQGGLDVSGEHEESEDIPGLYIPQ